MQSNLAGWLERIEKSTLPAVPRTAEAIAVLVKNENAPLPSYAAIIELDPGLTVALLRRIRSLRKRRLDTEITTVEHTLMLLGLSQVRALLPTVPLIDAAIPDENVRDHLLALYMRGNEAAFHARAWARLRKDLEPDEVYTATLLHGLAEMLMWQNATEEMRQIDALRAEKEDMPPHEAQYVVLGFSMEQLTAQLAERWGLPSLVHEALLPENATKPRVTSIMLASHLARAVEHGWYNAEVTEVIKQIAEHLHLDFDGATALVHRTAAEAARALPCSRVVPTAFKLIFPSQPDAERGHAPPAAAPGVCMVPQPELLRRALHELQRQEHGGTSVKEVLQTATVAMHEAIGLNRVVFAALGKDRTLKARHVLCPGEDPKFSRFEVELNEGTLFDQLMRKPQALWLNETNRERFAAYLAEDFLQLIGHDNFFALSLFVDDKPIGLFYADRHHSSCALDANAYHQFKQLGLQAARTLAASMGK